MSITVYASSPPGFGQTRELRRLTLGRAPIGGPACDECRRPANLELAGRAYCAPCLEELVEAGRTPRLPCPLGDGCPRP